MDRRLMLHEILCKILGNRNVYFQAPANNHMNYPCIKYEVSSKKKLYANDKPYVSHTNYTLTFMTIDPEPTDTIQSLESLSLCKFDRSYVADGLNHFVYNIYY